MHGLVFAFVVQQKLIDVYGDTLATKLWIFLGWMLFAKLTHTYFWVTTSNPGTLKSLQPPELPSCPSETKAPFHDLQMLRELSSTYF